MPWGASEILATKRNNNGGEIANDGNGEAEEESWVKSEEWRGKSEESNSKKGKRGKDRESDAAELHRTQPQGKEEVKRDERRETNEEGRIKYT